MYSWGEIAKVGRPILLNLVVVFEARRTKHMTPFRAAEVAKQLVICVAKERENKRSHTDSISQSLAAEGAMHE